MCSVGAQREICVTHCQHVPLSQSQALVLRYLIVYSAISFCLKQYRVIITDSSENESNLCCKHGSLLIAYTQREHFQSVMDCVLLKLM